MLRRETLLLSLSSLLPTRSLAQSRSSDFRQIALDRIPEDARIADEMYKQEAKDYLFVPPIFRYRIEVSTKGRLEPLNTDESDTLKKWGTFVGRPDFASIFEHKVEVQEALASQWVFWQSQLLQPFRDELSKGGEMTMNTLLIGARHRQPLLLAIGFQSL